MEKNRTLPPTFRRKSPSERLILLRKLLLAKPDSEKINNNKELEAKCISVEKDFLLPNSNIESLSDTLVESAIGSFALPIGIVKNLRVNQEYVHVPVATEEASVISAATYAAKILEQSRENGIVARCDYASQIAQIALDMVSTEGELAIRKNWKQILDRLMQLLERMHRRGGGLRKAEFRRLPSELLVFHFTVDVRDAMGANIVNAAAEALSPMLEEISGGKKLAAILSNYCEQRLAQASCTLDASALPAKNIHGTEAAKRIAQMCAWAREDLYRAVTHNKGIMNGVTGLALATGNDTRALEAAVHSYASTLQPIPEYYTRYGPLSSFDYSEGQLSGRLAIPALLATAGGSTSHPAAQWSLRILGINHAKPVHAHQLNCIAAALGLAQNFAALFALVSTGIYKGHIKYHSKKQGKHRE